MLSESFDSRYFLLCCGLTLLSLVLGCQPAPVRTVDSDETSAVVDDGAEDKNGGDREESGSDKDQEAVLEKSHDEDNTAATQPPATDEATNSISSAAVVLGDPTLTTGIPGDGPLTVDSIKTWLDKPENHEELLVSLPMGLDGAAANITGLDANPMTRAKIELGRQLYFDTRLSKDNTVSCASCHHPDEGYGRRTQFGEGIGGQTGNRNSPVSYNRIVSGPQFWDGRAESLEAQAVGPIANPIEMGNTHENCVATVKAIEGYRLQFEKIFGAEGVTIDNIGKAIATFERALVTGPAPYDHLEVVRGIEKQWGDEIADLEVEDPETYAKYQASKTAISGLSEAIQRGRDLFFSEKSNCTACHAGANFSDEKYHNLGVGMQVDEPDLGRFTETKLDIDRGAFKTPTVRNVAVSAPYMHDGSQQTLEEVVDWYVKGGHANPYLSEKVKKLELTDQDKQDLVAFMSEGLTGSFPTVEMERLPQ